jgi:hypothetical protein
MPVDSNSTPIMSKSKIVISYRRSSYDAIVGRIRDKLVGHYGDEAVYMDVDNIPFGIDFREHINNALKEGDVLVAVIGHKWLGPIRGRKARIFDETDPVRVEIETALNRGIAVVPILVDGAKMPKPEELPGSISKLAFHNAATVDGGRDFHQHMDRVIRSMDLVLKAPPGVTAPAQRQTPSGDKGRLRLAAAATGIVALAIFLFGAQRILYDRIGQTPAVETRAIDTPVVAPASSPTNISELAGPKSEEPVTAAAANLERRVALIIGNSSYQEAASLKNTVNDAVAVSNVFRSLGFSVITRTNIGRREFENAIRAFQDQAEKADLAVIYYAGHAVEMSGMNYLIPTDAKVSVESDLKTQAVPMDTILSAIEGAHQLRLIFLDACRDNPFASLSSPASGTRSIVLATEPPRSIAVDRGLARIEVKLPNTLIVYAAKAGQVASDGDGDHGPFAAALIKHLGTPNLDIRIVLGRVRDDVLRSTSGRQEPYIYGSLGGETFALAGTK